MSTIATLQAELDALDAFLATKEAHRLRPLQDFVEKQLRLDNALALAARLPRPLGELFPGATPVHEWAHAAGSSFDVRPTPPEEERAFQWSFRYPAAVVATLERGRRPVAGWAPGNIDNAPRSTEPWDRIWALSEVVRLGLPLPDDAEKALVPLGTTTPTCGGGLGSRPFGGPSSSPSTRRFARRSRNGRPRPTRWLRRWQHGPRC